MFCIALCFTATKPMILWISSRLFHPPSSPKVHSLPSTCIYTSHSTHPTNTHASPRIPNNTPTILRHPKSEPNRRCKQITHMFHRRLLRTTFQNVSPKATIPLIRLTSKSPDAQCGVDLNSPDDPDLRNLRLQYPFRIC